MKVTGLPVEVRVGGRAGPGPVDRSEGFGEGQAGPGPVNKSEGLGGQAGPGPNLSVDSSLVLFPH